MSSASEEKETVKKAVEHTSHFIINRSLATVHLVADSCKEFMDFVTKWYDLFEYDYTIQSVDCPSVSTSEWEAFCHHFNEEHGGGKTINYKEFDKNPQEYMERYVEYIKEYKIFLENREKTRLLFPVKGNVTVGDLKKEKETKPLADTVTKVEKGSWTDMFSSNPIQGHSDSPYYFLNRDWQEQLSIKKDTIQTIVMYDANQSATYVIQDGDCKWVSKWITMMDGVVILKEYSDLYHKSSNDLRDYFNLRQVMDMEDATEKVNSYDLLHHLSKVRCEVELRIQAYLLRNYDISTDGKKLMKASVLQERIETALLDSTIGNTPMIEDALADTLKFRKLISSALLDMGLQKKRLSDGIYYYGIEPKIVSEQSMVIALDAVIKRREHQIRPTP